MEVLIVLGVVLMVAIGVAIVTEVIRYIKRNWCKEGWIHSWIDIKEDGDYGWSGKCRKCGKSHYEGYS